MRAADIPFDEARSLVAAVDSVLFFARVGERTVRCYITEEALSAYFGVGNGGEPHGCLAAFDRNVERIHEIARHRIGRGVPAGLAVVITANDVFRAITATGGGIRLRMRKGDSEVRLDPPPLSCSTSEPT